MPFEELHPLDSLNGFRVVMLHRIEGGLDDIRSALELFGYIMECAIEAVDDRNPRSYIALSPVEEFGLWFMDGLLSGTCEGASCYSLSL